MEDRTGQGNGYKGMSLYGQTLDWHGRGQLSGAKLVYNLLSAGTQEQPEPGHLVDDFQRTDQDVVYVCVSVQSVHVYVNVGVCAFSACKQHTCVCVSCKRVTRFI